MEFGWRETTFPRRQRGRIGGGGGGGGGERVTRNSPGGDQRALGNACAESAPRRRAGDRVQAPFGPRPLERELKQRTEFPEAFLRKGWEVRDRAGLLMDVS